MTEAKGVLVIESLIDGPTVTKIKEEWDRATKDAKAFSVPVLDEEHNEEYLKRKNEDAYRANQMHGATKVFGWKLEIYCNDNWYEIRRGDNLPYDRKLKRNMIQEELKVILPEEQERLSEWFMADHFHDLIRDI